jgi:putative nucleotidyltransferase with HDIG domain
MTQKSIRVTVLFLTFCKYIGIKKDKLFDLGCAALLHDIGMVKLPINFDKAGKLTYIERKHLFTHTEIGANLIEQSKTFPRAVSDIVRSHHENYDGSGYPKGLAKRDISLYSRMLTLICTYEAITRDRKYKAALNPYLSVSELARVSGFMLDPRLVARFIEVIGEYPFGTLVKTLDGEQLKVLDKAKGQKYFVTRPANDDKKNNFIMDSNLFTGVIYE